MKAAVRSRYGDADAIDIATVDDPAPGPEDVVVRVHAVSLNASDWEFLTGSPAYIRMWGLFKPRHSILGSDIAGTVVSVGSRAKWFQAGDEVFGDVLGHFGGLAEYASLPEKCLSRKPGALSMIEAATLPQAGLVALQGLRDKGRLQPGERVLINGAGGGSGSFAVQLAHAWGAHVTGVDRGEKLELIRSWGAEAAVDFTREDFTSQGVGYDLILDLAAHRSLFDMRAGAHSEGSLRDDRRERVEHFELPHVGSAIVHGRQENGTRRDRGQQEPRSTGGAGRKQNDRTGHRPHLPARPGA